LHTNPKSVVTCQEGIFDEIWFKQIQTKPWVWNQ